jgi:hypothetical protein
MAFRDGNKGPELWEQCRDNGVAAIAYDHMDFDLSERPKGEAKECWSRLSPAQQNSLRAFAYRIKAGDTIYVKQGPRIVGKGRVSKRRGSKPYFYEPNSPVKGEGGPWRHLMPVEWEREFLPVTVQIGDTQLYTIRPLSQTDQRKLDRARAKLVKTCNKTEAIEGEASRREARFRQRNRAFIEAKKANSDYRCEVCDFNFEETYGPVGREFIIAHHIEPIGSRSGASRTSLDDIRLVCANCHAMIHQKDPPLLVETLRVRLRRT